MASPKTPANPITAALVTRWFRYKQDPSNPMWIPVARWALRSVLTSPDGLNAPLPKGLATADISALVDAVVKAAIEKKSSATDLDALLKAKFDKFLADEPIIRVDNLLRNTAACDMPINCRMVLSRLAGHASKANQHECWVSRATLAGECGLSEPTLDRAIADLAEYGWIKKTHRFSSNVDSAAQTSSRYQIRGECGKWWAPADRLKKNRKPPVRQANTVPTMRATMDTDAPALPAAAADVADDFREASFADAAEPEKTEAAPSSGGKLIRSMDELTAAFGVMRSPGSAGAETPTPPSSKKSVQGDTPAAIAAFNAALAASAPPTVKLPPADPWKPSAQALAHATSKGIDVDALVASFTLAQGHRFGDPSQVHRLNDAFYQATMLQSVALASEAKRSRRTMEASAEASL